MDAAPSKAELKKAGPSKAEPSKADLRAAALAARDALGDKKREAAAAKIAKRGLPIEVGANQLKPGKSVHGKIHGGGELVSLESSSGNVLPSRRQPTLST